MPLDGTPTANLGLRKAIRLARARKAWLILLHVVDESPVYLKLEADVPPDEFARALVREGHRIVQSARRIAGRSHVPVRMLVRETIGEPAAEAIAREARRLRADLIVMGTHARRRAGARPSNAERVLRASCVPVLVVRGRR